MSKTKAFIEKARAKHGDRYGYSKTVYVHSKKKVIITCKEHGDFEQSPNNHIRRDGCAKCSGRHRYSTAEWIAAAKEKHDNVYDYSKTEYVRTRDKVVITCNIHGDFEQIAFNHMLGKGCPKCSLRYTYTTVEWVEIAIRKHGVNYDYSKTKFSNSKEKVVITCLRHGDFEQVASSHLMGKGCPKCPNRYDQPTAIYIMTNGNQVKIGISLNPERRMGDMNRVQPFAAKLLSTWILCDFPTALKVEGKIHSCFSDKNAGFSGFNGATEWFNTTPEYAIPIIEKIISHHT